MSELRFVGTPEDTLAQIERAAQRAMDIPEELGNWPPARVVMLPPETALSLVAMARAAGGRAAGICAVVNVADLREPVELAAEGWAYATEYFSEKWDAEARLAKARNMLGESAWPRCGLA